MAPSCFAVELTVGAVGALEAVEGGGGSGSLSHLVRAHGSATADGGTSASVHPCQASASGWLMDHVVVAVLIAVATANLKLDVGHVSPCC